MKVNLPVESSIVAPVPNFQTPGGGIQLRFNFGTPSIPNYKTAEQMLKLGLIIEF